MPNKILEKWEEKTFEKCIENIQYTNKIPKKDFKENGLFPIISQEEEYISGYWDDKNDLFKIKKPIVIFGDHTKNIKYVDFDFVLGADGVKIISTIDDILPKYMYYYLQNIQLRDLGYARHYKLLKEKFVLYPNMQEQQRIVKILDEAFENIEKARQNALQNLNNAKELFESSLNNLLSKDYSNVKKLDDICKITSKLTDPRLPQNQYLLHVGGANIEQKNGMLINLMTAKEEKLISNKFIFDDRMVLYSKIRPYLRKVVRPNFSGLCSADIYPLLPDTNYITRDYLFYLLLSKSFTEYAIEGSARAGMPKVNRPHLFAYTCKLPTIIEQQKIVAQLDELQEQTKRLEQIYEQKIKDLDELKQSILQKAFNGEL